MDSKPCDKRMIEPKVGNRRDLSQHAMSVLHQNVQSLNNKLVEFEVLLHTDLKYVDVLCFTEHWQNDQQLNCTNISQSELVISFCRNISEHGGSCICVKKNV
jgi:hypothetical protein